MFPLKEQGKRPIVAQGFHKATTDEGQVRQWWDRWPQANIGIPCGEKTFCVVDIDPAKGGAESLKKLEAEHGKLPPTLQQITGGSGIHYCFTPDPRVGNSESKIALGIDTRGNDKGYICVAPSIHETGNLYRWANEGTPLACIPEWIIAKLAGRPAPEVASGPPYRRVKIDRAVDDRARAYLQQCEPAVQGQGGHARLLWACSAMVHGFELDDYAAYQLLAEEYNPRCMPPWNLGNPTELREFQRKISQGRREKQKPRGWLLNEMHQADEAMINHARAQADSMIQAAITVPKTAKTVPVAVKTAVGALVIPSINRPPDHILYPPGLVGDVVSYISQTARKPQPLLALGNALSFCGALFGRKIRDEWDLRTNVYILGVAESGAGKEHSRQVIKRLCLGAGVTEQLLGGEEITSDSAIASRLDRHPVALFQWDEIGHMMASLKDTRASGHRRSVIPYLMRLTGSANSVLLGKEYTDDSRKDIIQPHVCVYGTTVPDVFYQSISTAEIRDGLLGRFLVFRVWDDDPNVNDVKMQPMPAALIEQTQEWVQFQPEPPLETGDIQRHTGAHQITIPTDPKAQTIYLDFRSDIRRRRKEAIAHSEPHAPLWGRVEEHARRVGLTISGGDCAEPASARITVAHAEYGCNLVLYLTVEFVKATAISIADSENERQAKRIHEMVMDAGAEGLKHRDLSRRCRALTSRQRTDIVKNLLDGEYIIQVPLNRTVHYFCPPFGLNLMEEVDDGK